MVGMATYYLFPTNLSCRNAGWVNIQAIQITQSTQHSWLSKRGRRLFEGMFQQRFITWRLKETQAKEREHVLWMLKKGWGSELRAGQRGLISRGEGKPPGVTNEEKRKGETRVGCGM